MASSRPVATYTAKGRVLHTGEVKINLFDGRYDTGFKVIEFLAWSSDLGGSTAGDVAAKLCTESGSSTATGDFFDASDNRQIGWSSVNADQAAISSGEAIIDPDNLIIEDLYVVGRTRAGGSTYVNYMIVMEKYNIDEWEGALGMVRNQSQDVGA